jgi:hypothetical protein
MIQTVLLVASFVDVLFKYSLIILLVDMYYRIFSHFGEKQKDEPQTLRNLEIKTGTAKKSSRRINRQIKNGITDG